MCRLWGLKQVVMLPHFLTTQKRSKGHGCNYGIKCYGGDRSKDLFFFFFFFATPMAYGSSQARDRIQAFTSTYAMAVAMPDP